MIIEQPTYYLAYGMNTNAEEMDYRCPDAISIGRVDIQGLRLVFRGCADVEHDSSSTLQAVLWEITEDCEAALDILEGYPSFYDKASMPVVLPDGEIVDAMFYYMVGYENTEGQYHPPSANYFRLLKQGYEEHDLDFAQLKNAPGVGS